MNGLLLLFGLGLLLIGCVSFAVAAFRKGLLWGFGALLLPPVSLAFAIIHWRDIKGSMVMQLLGFGMMVLAVYLSGTLYLPQAAQSLLSSSGLLNTSQIQQCITRDGDIYFGKVPDDVVCRSSSTINIEQSYTPSNNTFVCDGRQYCSQMSSCAEAKYFIRHCPNTKMDGNNDGIPCESQWCGR